MRLKGALYIVIQNGVNDKTLPKLVSIANKYRVPTFSQQGSEEVSKGVLMRHIPAKAASVLSVRSRRSPVAKILQWRQTAQINQVRNGTIAINLKTAEIIGLYLSADILAAADEIYREIANP